MGKLISLTGKKLDLDLVEDILTEAIGLEGSLLRGIFTNEWGGTKRAVTLYAKAASAIVPARQESAEEAVSPAEQAVAAAAPAFKEFIEMAVSQKLQSMMNDPECEQVNRALMRESQKALMVAGIRGAAAVKESIEFSEAWGNFRDYMKTNLPVGNFDTMMEGHLDALSEALVASAKVSSSLRRGTGLQGGQPGGAAFAMLGAETGEMYREELERIMKVAAEKVAAKKALISG